MILYFNLLTCLHATIMITTPIQSIWGQIKHRRWRTRHSAKPLAKPCQPYLAPTWVTRRGPEHELHIQPCWHTTP